MDPDSILENASDQHLGWTVEANLFALFRAMTALPNSQIEETTKLSRHFVSPTNPMYKFRMTDVRINHYLWRAG